MYSTLVISLDNDIDNSEVAHEILGDSVRYIGLQPKQVHHLQEFFEGTVRHLPERNIVIDNALFDLQSYVSLCQKQSYSLRQKLEQWHKEEPIGILLFAEHQTPYFSELFPHAELYTVKELRRGCVLSGLLKLKNPAVIGCTRLSPFTYGLPLRDPLRAVLHEIAENENIRGSGPPPDINLYKFPPD